MSDNVRKLWEKIKTDKIDYKLVDGGNQSNVYLYDKFAFKSGREKEIQKDMRIAELAHKSEANIPNIISYIENENVVVYERIDGTKIRNLSYDEKINTAFEIGNQLRKFHSIDYDSFGEPVFDENSVYGIYDTKEEFINNFIDIFKNISQNSNFEDLIEKVCIRLKECNPPPEKSVLCHGDIHISNLIYYNEKVYIIDFGDTTFGFPGTDVTEAYLNYYETSDYMAHKFLEGYGLKLNQLNNSSIYQGILKRLYTRMWHEKNNEIPTWWNDCEKDYYNYRCNKLINIINDEFPVQNIINN